MYCANYLNSINAAKIETTNTSTVDQAIKILAATKNLFKVFLFIGTLQTIKIERRKSNGSTKPKRKYVT
jgi:hypothetical protein